MRRESSTVVLGLCLLYVVGCSGVFTPVVEISQGKLRGLRSVSGQNRYYGIPYATSERFQPPREPPKWKGILTAVDRLGHCAQRLSVLSLGTEQCLRLDVYTPERPSLLRRPVLVFIHGGGYYYGTKAHYDPEFLVVKDVVVVIINYRVGVLGFLCVNGIANLGLKDQVAALKWIQKNIAAFDGDPDNVTICGQSAGASAAAMHLLSESSSGLFHKAILMSGSSMTPWAFNVEPLKPAFEDAAKLGTVSSEPDVYAVFSNASLGDLLSATGDVSTNSRYFKYSPCIDANNTDRFFHDTPLNIIKSGRFNKVPMIVGYTDVEGMLFYGIHDDESLKEWDENFVDRLPSVFSWCPDERKRRIGKKIRSHYFGTRRIDKRAIRGVVDFYSDWIAYATVDAFTALMGNYSDQPIYSYMFSYEGDRNFAKFAFGLQTGLKGASHTDDLFYIFKPAGLSLLLTKSDRLSINRLTTIFTNFMKFGDPTPSQSALLPTRWPAATAAEASPLSAPALTLRLARSLSITRATASRRGRFLHDMLCAHALPGYMPCDAPSSTINEIGLV